MVKSELYSNLRDVVELLYDSLLPEGSNAVSCRDSEEELNLLQEEISALDYSCLDEIYHAGPEEVVNDDLSPIENALISSVGLLDEYSLSEKEFREWIEKQPETYRPLLNMLTGVQPTPYYTEKMKTDFAEEFRKQLFDPAKSNTSPKNGMRFAENPPEDGSQNFWYLKKVLVFDKEFDDYNRVVQELKPIIQKARCFYLQRQADALGQKEACGDHFYETLMTFAQAFKDAQEGILRDATSSLRGREVEPDIIQSFRTRCQLLMQNSREEFLQIFEHMIEIYEQCYPQKEENRHEYIDYISMLRSSRRDAEIAMSGYSPMERDALYTANRMATSAVNRFANAFMDYARTSREQRTFAEKLGRVFESAPYKLAINMLFQEMGDSVDIEYTQMLGIETDIMSSERLEGNEFDELEKDFQTNNIDKGAVVEFLKTNTMRYPYDERLYAIAYLIFANDAGDLEGITKYLGIYDSFLNYMKEIYVPLLKQQMNLTMDGYDYDKLNGDMKFAEQLLKKYPLMQEWLKQDISLMKSRFNGLMYIAEHWGEELQRYHDIVFDDELLCYEDARRESRHFARKGTESFERKYEKYGPLIDQSIYGPIVAFYFKNKDDAVAYLAFTPEKLFITSGKSPTPYDYFQVEIDDSGCRVETVRFGMDSPQLLKELAEWEVTKKVKALLVSLGTVTEDNLPKVETRPEFVELLKILKNKFNICGYRWEKEPDIEIESVKNRLSRRFSDRETDKIVGILSLIGTKSAVDDIVEHPEKREEERKKAEEEKIFFADTWNTKTLEERLQHPDIKVSTLAKVECYLCKALDARKKDASYCRAYYSLYTKVEKEKSQERIDFVCAWIKEHPLDFNWTDEMEEANQHVQYQIYANKMLAYLKKNAPAKEQFDTAVRFAIQYDVIDEENNIVTSYERKIKFTMPLLANLELKTIFGTIPDALECHSYEGAMEHRNRFFEIVKKYSLGEVTGDQCVLNKMYDDMFAQKGSYAFYIQWLNNEFPSEVEYQKKLQDAKGIKKILVAASKPNHLATIE